MEIMGESFQERDVYFRELDRVSYQLNEQYIISLEQELGSSIEPHHTGCRTELRYRFPAYERLLKSRAPVLRSTNPTSAGE